MTLINYLEIHSALNLTADSRSADSSAIFIALTGTSQDGHKFLEDAYTQGCRHFIVEDDKPLRHLKNLHVFKVRDTKKSWAEAWKMKSKNSSEDIFVCGVTGTNGKTSISLMVEHILNFCDLPCGVIGTIDHHLNLDGKVKSWNTNLTTPGPETLFPRIQEMKSLGAKAMALEISSHALDQQRALGIDLDVAVFTNLSEDHLDYHGNFQNYFQSKISLFENLLKESKKTVKTSILNYSDEWIRTYTPEFGEVEILFETVDFIELSKDDQIRTLMVQAQTKNPNCKFNVLRLIRHDLKRLEFDIYFDVFKNNQLNLNADKWKFTLPIVGRFQAVNWAQAILACKSLGYEKTKLTESALHFKGIPGRLQKVLTSKPKSVFVDYSHTPDALEKSLKSLKDICQGHLIVVFGCGGERDKAKRSTMFKVAQQNSDVQIITNDNPRGEDPERILADILSGFDSRGLRYMVELDRRKAIQLGLTFLKTVDDVLLIAGKGHETYQILNDGTIEFNDYEVAVETIESAED